MKVFHAKTFLENLLNLPKKFYCIIRDCICFLESLDQDGLVPLLLRMFILMGLQKLRIHNMAIFSRLMDNVLNHSWKTIFQRQSPLLWKTRSIRIDWYAPMTIVYQFFFFFFFFPSVLWSVLWFLTNCRKQLRRFIIVHVPSFPFFAPYFYQHVSHDLLYAFFFTLRTMFNLGLGCRIVSIAVEVAVEPLLFCLKKKIKNLNALILCNDVLTQSVIMLNMNAWLCYFLECC